MLKYNVSRIFICTLCLTVLQAGCAQDNGRSSEDIWRAATYGNIDALTGFLDSGVDVDAREPGTDSTPLNRASFSGNLSCVKLLIERGADVTTTDKWNNSVLTVAIFGNDLEIIKLIVANGGLPESEDELNNIRGLGSLSDSSEITEYINSITD